jgi:plasmid stabilization system protein ParE
MSLFDLTFTDKAIEDIANIKNYTIQEFGEIQWDKYKTILNLEFEKISKMPSGGHSHPFLPNEINLNQTTVI